MIIIPTYNICKYLIMISSVNLYCIIKIFLIKCKIHTYNYIHYFLYESYKKKIEI